ncbi:hypothetical protein ABB37_06919 [Leptomonas pyrrhocoris]|uniref:Uncharacterized protein n=1 Tax=Leptomonas pyrrhocoris TaxID=157538 RepID=A0A0N0DTI8_LEPPY|nr:hypothetical protein ABB37_06919 [Leptomonas pyrrhocoris]KPA77542.1 hypothetical protein ABB37_06919 [Leptomonas pyrrhocoris]|eukprot:XP_015655981.1 hypothetical protein ABB37_06919 [Leptomonas pyrrhocoris]
MSNSASSTQLLFGETDRTAAPLEVGRDVREAHDTLSPAYPHSSPAAPELPLRTPPPPPLDRLALAASDSSVASWPRLCRRDGQPTTKPYRGVAVAVLRRVLHDQSPAGESAAASLTATATTTSAPMADASLASAHSPFAMPGTSLISASPAAAVDNSKNEDDDDHGDDTADRPACEGADDVLPWWRRILIDVAYRQRLMQLSTEAYRQELKLLQNAPDVISGTAGMEKRKVWRERQWWTDELAEVVTPLRYKLDEHDKNNGAGRHGAEAAVSTAAVRAPQGEDADDRASHPLQDEVDHTIVMAQHVVVTIPRHSSVSAIFALQHPHAIIHASALGTIRVVALGRMPPAQHAHEEAWQEAAIDAHLRMQRRLSHEMSLAAKRKLAKDILADRQEVPMQTAITDALLETAAAKHSQHKTESQRTKKSGATHEPLIPRPPAPRSSTPPHWRDHLPPRIEAIGRAQHDVDVAVINVQTCTLSPFPMPATTKTAATTTAAPVCEESSVSRSHSSGDTDNFTSRNAKAKMEMHTPQQQLRCHEAAMACTDGTENLYGLQYVWRLPLPPSGFIRVSPDPRYAMWPDDARLGTGVSAHLVGGSITTNDHGSGGGDGRGAGHPPHDRNASRSTILCSRRRQRQMRRLARRVNERAHKLRWLHEIGRRRVCYNDLALETESDASSPSSSSVSFRSDSTDSTLMSQQGDPTSPSRFSLNVARQVERRKRGVAADGRAAAVAAARRRRLAARAAARGEVARPIYDGALNINVYADVLDTRKLPANDSSNSKGTMASAQQNATSSSSSSSSTVMPPHYTTADAPTRRVFLGCYRQSRMLIHYKVYCRALHEEARVRCGPPLTHVIGRAQIHSSSAADARHGQLPDEPSVTYDAGTAALLRGVPAIPYPVLRLQTEPPTLRQPHARQTPDLSTVREACCWVGLFPSARVDLASEAHHAWRTLRESALVQQALRDIFEDLPHDKEGLLDKRTFVLFVLQLLELFFPSYLSPTTHVAIAEEEWAYRGTTEHVGPHTFHEKFFGFPFIFMRDIATVTETELVEFWSILRLCLRAQQEQTRLRLPGEAATPPEALLSALHLLVPLTSLNPTQLLTLIARPPPAFDPVVYDRFCLLTEAFRSDPDVHRAPRASQYTVARARVEHQLRLREAQRRLSGAAKAAVRGTTLTPAALLASASRAENNPTSETAPLDIANKLAVSVSDLLSGSAGTTSRIGIENAVQREREEQQRRAEALEKRVLLEQSAFYEQRQQHLHVRTAAVVSAIEGTSSSWELHRADVYEPPSQSCGGNLKDSVTADRNTEEGEGNEDVEDALLEYLDGVPCDVFGGRVSLRERYLLHIRYQRSRRGHDFPWLQNRAVNDTADPASTSAAASPAAVSSPNTIRLADRDREVKTRRFLSVMKGEGSTVQERQLVVAAECERLLGSPRAPVTTTVAACDEKDKDHQSKTTTSYAAGIYPLRPVPRRTSSILLVTDQRARMRILEQADYTMSDASRTGSFVRKASDRSVHNGSAERLPRRVPSRVRMEIPSSSFYGSQGRRHLAQPPPTAAAGKTTRRVRTASATASATAQHQRRQPQLHRGVGSRGDLKRKASNTMQRTHSFGRHPSAPSLSKVSAYAAAAPAVEPAPPSLPLSRAPSLTDVGERVTSSYGVEGAGPAGMPNLARPITNVSFIEADLARNNNDDVDGDDDWNSTTVLSMPLGGSYRSFFTACGDRRGSNASLAASAAQQRLSTAARTASPATLYAGRLRAQQRRQQQYQERFNANRGPAATLKR